MARYPLNLPQVLKQDAEDLATQQGVSLNQFILWAVAEKVGALRQDLGDPEFPGIVYTIGAAGRPTPKVRGTGTSVQALVVASTRWGMTAPAVARDYELPERMVREALAFYQVHRDEVDALIAADEATEVAASARATDG